MHHGEGPCKAAIENSTAVMPIEGPCSRTTYAARIRRPSKGKHFLVVANFEGWVTYVLTRIAPCSNSTSSAAQLPNVGGDISRIGRKRHNSESRNTALSHTHMEPGVATINLQSLSLDMMKVSMDPILADLDPSRVICCTSFPSIVVVHISRPILSTEVYVLLLLLP